MTTSATPARRRVGRARGLALGTGLALALSGLASSPVDAGASGVANSSSYVHLSADGAERWVQAAQRARLEACTSPTVSADSVERCLARP